MEENETGKNQSQAEFSIQTKRDEIRENEKVIGPNYDVSDLNAAYKTFRVIIFKSKARLFPKNLRNPRNTDITTFYKRKKKIKEEKIF